MAQKDIMEKALVWYNDVFSDIVNNLLFNGEAVVKPAALRDTKTHLPYKSDSKEVRDQDRDSSKVWLDEETEIRLSYFGIENETEAKDDMPFRVRSILIRMLKANGMTAWSVTQLSHWSCTWATRNAGTRRGRSTKASLILSRSD